MIKKKGHTQVLDWYLLGVVFYELIVGLPPYFDENSKKFMQNIQSGVLLIPKTISSTCKDFLVGLLSRKPEKRLGAISGWEEISQHPFLSDVDWQKLSNL
jgi:serum/glucocorticoid-regulated kinase 2